MLSEEKCMQNRASSYNDGFCMLWVSDMHGRNQVSCISSNPHKNSKKEDNIAFIW